MNASYEQLFINSNLLMLSRIVVMAQKKDRSYEPIFFLDFFANYGAEVPPSSPLRLSCR